MLKYIRRHDDQLPPHREYMERRFKKPAPAAMVWGRLPLGPTRFYEEWTSGYMPTTGLQIYEVKYAPSADGRPHKHDYEEQGYYVVSGRANLILNESRAEVGPGTITYTPPGILHGYNNIGTGPLSMLDIHSFLYDDLKPTKLKITEVTTPPGGACALHAHPEGEGALYVVSGHAAVTVGDEEATLEAGGSAYLPRGMTHGYRNTGATPLVVVEVDNHDVP